MRRLQPDNRIHPEDLGMLFMNDKKFVINLRRGVPFNACVEEVGGALRCWASHRWLDDRAAKIVENFATKTDGGSYVWNEDVKRGSLVCSKADLVRTKGDSELPKAIRHGMFKVIFP